MAPLVRQIESLKSAGVDVTSLQVTGWPKLKYFQTIPRLRRAAKQVDLIHAHYGFCGWLARTCCSKPVVVSFMGDDLLGTPDQDGRLLPFSRAIVRSSIWLASKVDAVIVKSPEMARALAPLPTHIIPNGVDLDSFLPMDTREARLQLGWDTDKRHVLFPGNPQCARKGFPLANAAIQRARRHIDDPIEVALLRKVSPAQVPLYMNASDAMLMTSFIEGSPNVVKEAMACNLPAVSVPVGDVAELLRGVPGYEVRQRDADEIGKALVSTLRQRKTASGRAALISRGLDLASVARRILSIYEAVLHPAADRRHLEENAA